MNYIHSKEKLPRKLKKKILGKRMSQCQLNRLLKTVVVVKPSKRSYNYPVIEPYMFCPKCGCTKVRSTGNMVSYPEHWEEFYCLRCNKIVAAIDNSPFTHVLELKNHSF